MRKIKLFVTSAVLLILAAIVTVVATTVDNTAYVSITESGGEETDGIYTLNFNVVSENLRSAQFVFSYDNTVIIPCTPEGTTLEISESEQSDITACFTPADGFNVLSPEYLVNGTLTTVNLSLSTDSEAVDFSEGAIVCGFSYKVADGKTKDASSLRLETAGLTDSMLSLVFPTSSTASPIKIDNSSSLLYLSSDGETGAVLSEFTFSYEGTSTSVSGTFVTVRDDGQTPIVNAESGYSNLALFNIYTSSDKQELVRSTYLENAATNTASVAFEIYLSEGSYYGEILKNGYLPYYVEFTVTESGAQLGEILLVTGDISGSYDDAYGDGVVDIDDFIRVIRGFSSATEEAAKERLDIDEDGIVTAKDLSYVKSSLG